MEDGFFKDFLIDTFLMLIGLAFLVVMIIVFLKYAIPVDAL